MEPAWDIVKRQGLPDELALLVQKFPRETWRGHGNFSELTAFWLDRHLMFRDLIARLQGMSQTALDGGAMKSRELARFSGFFLDQLHHHHQIEDHHYFPQLIKVDARLARGFEMLETDHVALDTLLHDLASTTNAVLQGQGGDRTLTGRLLEAQNAAAAFLDRHLADEEDLIVPLILEHAPEVS